MSSRSTAGNRLHWIVRAALLLAGLSTYLISRDDVVWHFIKTALHPRVWEHSLFGLAAALLGVALLLKVSESVHPKSQDRSRITAAVASFLEAIGIGSLLPLPGFLVLALGDLGTSLLLDRRQWMAEDPRTERDLDRAGHPLHASRWGIAFTAHIALCCAFLSMAVFSVLLIDRVADVLFAVTALVSIAANLRPFRTGAR
jgi:hypothetical protein